MIIAVACDHAGLALKAAVLETILSAGHEALDFGVHTPERVDYPDAAKKVGRALQQGFAQRAVAICGSGVGVCIAANKMTGVYAALCHDTYSAHQGVEHDGMNTLCLGGRIIGSELAKEIVRSFLGAEVLEEGQHPHRREMIRKMEAMDSSDHQ